MISFIFGGAGGMINASFNLNTVVHNTTWVPGHFHVTVGTATTLTFMGITFWLLPHLTRKRLFSNRLALWASWLWFVGMMVFALGMHWQGLLSVPRRAQVSNLSPELQGLYADAAVPAFITGISGAILFVAIICYFTVFFGTLFARTRLSESDTPGIPFTQEVRIHNQGVTQVLDRLNVWIILAVVLVLFAYGPVLVDMLLNQVPIPGLKLW
jgi:cytochrome c oxidase subunit 1